MKVSRQPSNGTVKVDRDGNWSYKPNKDYVGKDEFAVKYTNTDGEEEEQTITLDVEEPPRSAPKIDFGEELEKPRAQIPYEKQLPKTGTENLPFEIIGMMTIAGAAMLRRKDLKNRK